MALQRRDRLSALLLPSQDTALDSDNHQEPHHRDSRYGDHSPKEEQGINEVVCSYGQETESFVARNPLSNNRADESANYGDLQCSKDERHSRRDLDVSKYLPSTRVEGPHEFQCCSVRCLEA